MNISTAELLLARKIQSFYNCTSTTTVLISSWLLISVRTKVPSARISCTMTVFFLSFCSSFPLVSNHREYKVSATVQVLLVSSWLLCTHQYQNKVAVCKNVLHYEYAVFFLSFCSSFTLVSNHSARISDSWLVHSAMAWLSGQTSGTGYTWVQSKLDDTRSMGNAEEYERENITGLCYSALLLLLAVLFVLVTNGQSMGCITLTLQYRNCFSPFQLKTTTTEITLKCCWFQ